MKLIRVKRIYDAWDELDGYRVLSDRLWPRGISKMDARLDEWAKDIAPSSQLRKKIHQNEITWEEFALEYQKELAGNPRFTQYLASFKNILQTKSVTLLTAAKLQPYSYVDTLKAALEKSM